VVSSAFDGYAEILLRGGGEELVAGHDRSVVDSKALTGRAVVRGTRISATRISAELVVDLLAAVWSHAQILES
jgi:uncharacterized protein (DUF433 family)